MIFSVYFSRHILFSRTFQESLLNSSTFQACVNPVFGVADPVHHGMVVTHQMVQGVSTVALAHVSYACSITLLTQRGVPMCMQIHICIQLDASSIAVLVSVQPVLSDNSKIDKTTILMTNGSLMKVESIAECSPWSILQYF